MNLDNPEQETADEPSAVEVPNVRPNAVSGLEHEPLKAKPSTLAGRTKPPGIPANEPPEAEAEAEAEPDVDADVVAEEDQSVPTGGRYVEGEGETPAPDADDPNLGGTGDAPVNPATESPEEVLHDAVTPSGADHDGGVVEEPADTKDSPEPAASTPDEGAAETSSGESAAAGASATEPAPAADATEDDEKRPPPTSPPA